MKDITFKNKIIIYFASIFFIFSVFPVDVSADINTGLVGYWSFDGKDTNWTTNTATDKSGNGNTGTLTDMSTTTSPVQGKVGQALLFDNTDDRITVSSDVLGTGDLSICAWVYPKSLGQSNFGRIVVSSVGVGEKTQLLTAFSSPNSVISFSSDGGTTAISSPTTLTFNRWLHVCVTRDSLGAGVLYQDGVQVNSGSTGTPATGATITTIGNRNSADRTFDGSIDELRVYNRVLFPNDIVQLYKMGQSRVAQPAVRSGTDALSQSLVGHWSFDGKDTNWTTNTITDRSGNGNTATMVNISTSTSRVQGKVGQALSLDGTDDYVTAASVSLSNPSFCAWIRHRGGSLTSNQGVVGKYDYGLSKRVALLVVDGQTSDIGRVIFVTSSDGTYQSGNAASSTTLVNDDRWHHVCGVYDTTYNKVYVDGVLEKSTDRTNDGVYSTSQITMIGTQWNNGSPDVAATRFDGSLDEVVIFDRALSAQDVLRLYKQGMSKASIGSVRPTTDNLSQGLVGYYTFDGKDTNWTTNKVTDKSGTGNTGTMLTMSTTSAPVQGRVGQALSFAGSSDITLGTSATLDFDNTYFTVCAWVKPRTAGDILVSRGGGGSATSGGWGVRTDQIFTKASDASTAYNRLNSTTITLGVWSHICVGGIYSTTVTNDTSFDFYTNGVLANGAESKISAAASGDAFNARIGSRSYSGGVSQYANSVIDEVRIYNRLLSAQEISKLYKQGQTKNR